MDKRRLRLRPELAEKLVFIYCNKRIKILIVISSLTYSKFFYCLTIIVFLFDYYLKFYDYNTKQIVQVVDTNFDSKELKKNCTLQGLYGTYL